MGLKELLDETGIPYRFISEEEMEEEKKLRQKKSHKKYRQSEKGKGALKRSRRKYRKNLKTLTVKEIKKRKLPAMGTILENGRRVKQYRMSPNTGKVLQKTQSLETFERQQSRRRKSDKIKRRRFSKFIKRVKLSLGCGMCGYKKCQSSLHFDHINPSEKKVMISAMGHHDLKTVKKEIRKCRILCANCHGEHTEQQMRAGVFA